MHVRDKDAAAALPVSGPSFEGVCSHACCYLMTGCRFLAAGNNSGGQLQHPAQPRCLLVVT